jgi:hypothetical protein
MVDLRLDTREGLFSSRGGKAVVAPGKPAESLLVQRINHAQGALRMPPAASKKSLTADQRALLEKWIAQGASWKEHWAFTPPSRPVPPPGGTWARNPIDRFVLRSLNGAGLEPAPEADKRTLIRRASLDITGLPPSPADMDAFLRDTSPNAYDRLVDRLLESNRYGEHRARYWLDAARYADTHGLHIDNYREMWPYRDWVINAFNRNVPFDRFTIEQVAGDLLPNRTIDQQIASGFHRCNVTTNEGGSIPDEVAAIYAKDRVDTTGAVWLGLTLGCASCHDHKFDPLSQREFYQFAAFFRNTTQNPMDGNIPDTPPILFVPKKQDEARWNELRAEVARIADAKKERRQAVAGEFDAWLAKRELPAEPLDTAALPLAIPAAEGVAAGAGPTANTPALHFGEKAAVNVPAPPGFDAAKPFTIAAWVLMPKSEDAFTIASQSAPQPPRAKDDDEDDPVAPQGWAIEISGRIPNLRLGGGEAPIRVTGNNIDRQRPGTWTHLVFTYDGLSDQRGMTLYMNGKASRAASRDNPQLKGSPSVDAPIRLGGEARRYFMGGAIADFRVYNRAVNAEEAALLASWNKIRDGSAERDSMLSLYANRLDAPYRGLQSRLVEAEAERQSISRRGAITHVMQEKGESMPEANILFRGQYDQPREKVPTGTPAVLPPMPESFPRNRLGLAQWLVDAGNPLTARVTVNRMWQEVFGAGLVRTAEDFGSQGLPPSHPELLDWLAVEFRESGWDMRRMYALMLKSATYRQAAVATERKLRVDPENKLLSRGPRFRMDGEMVRDLFLASSGLLGTAIGGPSVRPYQPDGIWETVAMNGSNTRFYKRDTGDSLYRRSLYTFWKRSAPPPSMEIFNAPTRENCTVRRERTNTPLQALVTMNDPQLVEASRALAERAVQAGAAFDARLDAITLRALGRPFASRERQVVRRELGDLLSHYDSKPAEANKLIAVGDSKPSAHTPPAELAAWTMVASSILNLDEALNK